MEELIREADKVIVKMTDGFPQFAHLGSNKLQHHNNQSANPNKICLTHADVNASYEVDFNLVGEICHSPNECNNKNKFPPTCDNIKEYACKCKNKLPQAHDAPRGCTRRSLPQACQTHPKTDQLDKNRPSSEDIEPNKLEKLTALVAEKLSSKPPAQSFPQAPDPHLEMKQATSGTRR